MMIIRRDKELYFYQTVKDSSALSLKIISMDLVYFIA